MTTSNECMRKFIEWNIAGTGRNSMVAGNHRYLDKIFYYQDAPWRRFVYAPGIKRSICLIKDPAWDRSAQTKFSEAKSFQYKEPFPRWNVPDIGVFSRHQYDELSEIKLHERLHKVFLWEVQAVLPEYMAMPLDATNTRNIIDKVTVKITDHYTRWHNWSITFDLRWDPLPSLYREEAIDAMTKRVLRYVSPKEQEKRERQRARKLLNKALGHD